MNPPPTPGGPSTQADHYTRNGFAGPATVIVRTQYTPTYTRVVGDYRPVRIDLSTWSSNDAGDPGTLQLPILDGGEVRVDLWCRQQDTPFAVKDVGHDQLLYVMSGSARLETDFGLLDLVEQDMVLVPRSVAYRLRNVHDVRFLIIVSKQAQHLRPENFAMSNPGLHVDAPRPYAGSPEGGEHELLLRHEGGVTSYFYDYDPLHMLGTGGAPTVQRFNFTNVHPLTVPGLGGPPARLCSDDQTTSILYYLGARDSAAPPVHHNADYDEIVLYSAGPGAYGEMRVPGTLVFVPKGVIHQGPEQNVPEGFTAWLLETRADMKLTAAGEQASVLSETSLFGVHPSLLQPAAAG